MSILAGGGGSWPTGVKVDTNSRSGDAFGRVRVSTPTTLFESTMLYDKQPLLWEDVVTGVGSVVYYDQDGASCSLDVTADEARVTRQSRVWPKYRAGKSHLVALTFNFNLSAGDVIKTIGLSDGTTGVELIATENEEESIVSVAIRSGGSIQQQAAQSAWNIDTFDGTGPSGIVIDWTKAQILMIDLQWLGVGRVRIGFDIDGVLYPAHEFRNANNLSGVYMKRASLPVRYDIQQVGENGGSLIQICSAVISEGGFEEDIGVTRSAGNGITGIGVTTRRPICSIRPKLTFNSIANRALLIPIGVELVAATNPGFWELVYDGTLTGPSWTSVGANSFAEVSVAATAISGGEVIASGFAPDAANALKVLRQLELKTKIPLTLNMAGDASTPLSLVVTSFTGTCTANGLIHWVEYG